MKLAVFGLGYIGLVTGVCLAERGHRTLGVDIDGLKIKMINSGRPPFVEIGLSNLLAQVRDKGLFKATVNAGMAVREAEAALVCVGTPSKANGSLDTASLEQACQGIGQAMRKKRDQFIVVIRSTIIPGTIKDIVERILEQASGKKQGKDFFIAFNPEFLREGSAVSDFQTPGRIIVGCDYPEIADKVLEIYKDFAAPKIKTGIRVAEMVKYADNCFHALKITFANEIGHICKSLDIDGRAVMDLVKSDKKLNITDKYLEPGFAFGGSCLPKDLRAINYLAKMHNIEIPFLNSILESNNVQILEVIKRIIAFNKRKIGIIGFSFKAMVSDIRESPLIEIIETLLGRGFDVKLYDTKVSMSSSTYIGEDYFHKLVQHLKDYFVYSLEELVKDRELIIIGNYGEEYASVLRLCRKDQIIFDLVGIKHAKNGGPYYEGVCW